MAIEEVHVFRAWVRGATIDAKGELNLSVVVPKEFKYEALKITDVGGFLQWFTVSLDIPDTDEELFDGFTLPEGGELGDGRGEETSRGGKKESPNLYEGKQSVPGARLRKTRHV